VGASLGQTPGAQRKEARVVAVHGKNLQDYADKVSFNAADNSMLTAWPSPAGTGTV
jgi:hypothetical protein